MWTGLPSDTAPILRGKSQRNDTDQQEIRRTTFNVSPPGQHLIQTGLIITEMGQCCKWVLTLWTEQTLKNEITVFKYYSQDGGKSSPQLATNASVVVE
jgi:hypothetical protein